MNKAIPKLAVYISLMLTLLMFASMLVASAISRAAIHQESQNANMVYLDKLHDLYLRELDGLKDIATAYVNEHLADTRLKYKLRTDYYEHYKLSKSMKELRRESPQVRAIDVYMDGGSMVFHSSPTRTAPNIAEWADLDLYLSAVDSGAFSYVTGLRVMREYGGYTLGFLNSRVCSIAIRVPPRDSKSKDYAVFHINSSYITNIANSAYLADDSIVFLFDDAFNARLSFDQRTGGECALNEADMNALTELLGSAKDDHISLQLKLEGETYWLTGARRDGGLLGVLLVREATQMASVYITLRALSLCFLLLLLAGVACSFFIDRRFFTPIQRILGRAGLNAEAGADSRNISLTPTSEYVKLDSYITHMAHRQREQEARVAEYFNYFRESALANMLLGNKRAFARLAERGALMGDGYDGYLCALASPDVPELTGALSALGRSDRLEMPGGEIAYIVSIAEGANISAIKARLSALKLRSRVCLGEVQPTLEDIRLSYATADKLIIASAERGAGVYVPDDLSAVSPDKRADTAAKEDGSRASTQALVKRVVSYVEARYMEDIGLNTIADYVYLSPSYLGRLFKEETGYSFTNYVIKVRMEQAAKLLTESDMMVSQVMERVGYFSIQGFGRVFKSYFNCSPSEYRKNAVTNTLDAQS